MGKTCAQGFSFCVEATPPAYALVLPSPTQPEDQREADSGTMFKQQASACHGPRAPAARRALPMHV